MLSSRLRILALPHMLIRVDRETADVDVDAVPAENLVRTRADLCQTFSMYPLGRLACYHARIPRRACPQLSICELSPRT